MIGPLPPPIGGTRVSFGLLTEALSRRDDVEIRLVDLPHLRANPLSGAVDLLRRLRRIRHHAPQVDVISLHCNHTALHLLGAAVATMAKCYRKPLVIRTFGGYEFLDRCGPLRRAIVRTVLAAANVYLAQTHRQIRMARRHGIPHVAWYPTSRPVATDDGPETAPSSATRRRFVFLGHIRKFKGVLDLIEAARELDAEATVDVYGPFRDGLTEGIFEGQDAVRYRGVLAPEAVGPTLRRYDALLMPTRTDIEGYPGVILEAYAAGLAVIASRCGAIPEIVDDTCGILVDPGDAGMLRGAMDRLIADAELLGRLRAGACRKRATFSLDVWVDRFVEICRETSSAGEHSADAAAWTPMGREF